MDTMELRYIGPLDAVEVALPSGLRAVVRRGDVAAFPAALAARLAEQTDTWTDPDDGRAPLDPGVPSPDDDPAPAPAPAPADAGATEDDETPPSGEEEETHAGR